MQCERLTSHGTPCKRQVTPGRTACNLHGGASLAAKIKAEQMMAQCRLPAIEALFRILEQAEMETPCPSCGYPKADADEKRMIIQACKTVLDRAGMGPHATLELTKQTDGDVNLELLSDGERADLTGALAVVKSVKDALRARAQGMLMGPSPDGDTSTTH